MNLTELKRVIDLGIENIKADPALYVDFANVYYSFFNEVCGSCESCNNSFTASYNRAVEHYKNPKTKIMSDFKIKGGGVINSIHGDFAQGNITNEIALKLIKEAPDYKNCFEPESLPKDLDEQLKSTTTFLDDAKVSQKKRDADAEKSTKTENENAVKNAAPKAKVETPKAPKDK